MSKNIWIINEYAGSPHHGMEYRHYYMGRKLKEFGYEVTIISSTYSHLFKKCPEPSLENVGGVNYLWLRTFNYGKAHNKKRVLKWFVFSFKLFFLRLSLERPSVIIVSSMAPFPIIPAYLISKMSKAKLIFEVKDIWPLSLVEIGGFELTNPLIKFMSLIEKFALVKSNVIVSNLQNYGKHIKEVLGKNKEFTWISNGVDENELKIGRAHV